LRLYRLVRWFVRWCLSIFFRQIEVVGEEHIPAEGEGAVVFAGNHPNSLIDPALVIAFSGRIVHFAAKDVLFRSAAFRPILAALGAVPVRRRMDHPDGKLDNASMFDQLFEVLAGGRAVGIFPEGISHDASQLAPLKTGAARIAAGVASRHPDCKVRIIPVGLNYGRRRHFRSSVLIRFGEPIELDEATLERHEDDPRAECRAITEQIDLSLRGLTINAEDWQTIRLLDTARRLYQPKGASLEARVELAQRFTNAYRDVADADDVRQAMGALALYDARLSLVGMRDRDLRRSFRTRDILARFYLNVVRVILWMPLAVPGFVLHAPLAIAARWLGWNLSPRKDVIATSKLVAGFALLALCYLFLIAVVAVFIGPLVALLLAPLLPLSGYATLRVLERYAAARSLTLSTLRFVRFRDEVRALRTERERLRRQVIDVVRRHLPDDMAPLFLDQALDSVGISESQ